MGRGGSSGRLLDDDGAVTGVKLMFVVGGNLGPQLRLIYVTGRYWHSVNTFNVTGREKVLYLRAGGPHAALLFVSLAIHWNRM